MESTLEMPTEMRPNRTKGEQCLDILRNMSPNQLGEFADVWRTHEPMQLAMFRSKLEILDSI